MSGEWRTMESAPRVKGARIIGWDGQSVETLTYNPPFRYPEHIEHPECWFQQSDSGRITEFYPTHWQHLPEPPQ